MRRHAIMIGRFILAGYASALCYTGEELLKAAGVFVATDEEVDAEGEDEPDPAPGEAAYVLTALDAEKWVNGLCPDYHEPGAMVDAENCGNYDCRWCWVNATGAQG